MFQVGRKYKSNIAFAQDIWICTAVGVHKVLLQSTNHSGVEYEVEKKYFSRYDEYNEPMRVYRYLNLYRSGTCTLAHGSRKEADESNSNAGAKRIACVRVELVEGRYDD